jgi:hypothetical protein
MESCFTRHDSGKSGREPYLHGPNQRKPNRIYFEIDNSAAISIFYN